MEDKHPVWFRSKPRTPPTSRKGALQPLNLKKLRVRPLAERRSLTSVEDILVCPDSPAPPCPAPVAAQVAQCAARILAARRQDASVILMYGAHLLRNGTTLILERMMRAGWLTHVATNGAGSIHDWEFAWLGRSTENVKENVATGTFGTWEETGRHLHVALMTSALRDEGYGRSVGRFITEDGATLPSAESLAELLRDDPVHPLTPARADLLQAMVAHGLYGGPYTVEHRWKHASILAQAFRHGIPATVHPGIGYDIISCHPMFNGAALGRAAAIDFRLFCTSVDRLDGGVVLSVGSAVMAPQVFEKGLSCVNNLRLKAGRKIVQGHSIFVIDLQDSGAWDWSRGEPPKTHPAYYLRSCKSFSRVGGEMRYVQCDNVAFMHNLLHQLRQEA